MRRLLPEPQHFLQITHVLILFGIGLFPKPEESWNQTGFLKEVTCLVEARPY